MNREKRTAIYSRLREQDPHPTTELHYETPFELLIAVILSAQTGLRDAIGKTELGELLSHRDRLGREIQEVLDAMPETLCVPLLLRDMDGLSYQEIADTLGITRNHVGVLLLRGRKKLRAQLADSTGTEN
mgnify:CR=1 FL=1